MEQRIIRTIKIDPPVDLGGESVSELIVREPNAGLLLKLSNIAARNRAAASAGRLDQVEDELPLLITELTGRPAEILHLLPMSIGIKLSEAVEEATDDSKGKGSDPS